MSMDHVWALATMVCHCCSHEYVAHLPGMGSRAKHNLHVPLSEPLHHRLHAEARRSGRPATTLAREAIEAWIEERQRQALHDAIVAYAEEMAGGPADLDAELENAGLAHLVSQRRKQ